MRSGREDGAATVQVLAMVGVLAFVAVGLTAGASLFHAQRQAQAAADLAALAAASTHVRGGDACTAARDIALANAARLVDCAPGPADVRVWVAVDGPRWMGRRVVVRAEARAGRAQSALAQSVLAQSGVAQSGFVQSGFVQSGLAHSDDGRLPGSGEGPGWDESGWDELGWEASEARAVASVLVPV